MLVYEVESERDDGRGTSTGVDARVERMDGRDGC
jgi:hypothetical protein